MKMPLYLRLAQPRVLLLVSAVFLGSFFLFASQADASTPDTGESKSVATSAKKGFGITRKAHSAPKLEALNVAWYYTWGPYPVSGTVTAEFVPMMWGISRKFSTHLADIQSLATNKKGGLAPVLLGFNEPDKPKQSNLKVARAVEAWPELAKLAWRVGSPATAQAPTGKWQSVFIARTSAAALPVDFIAMHVYQKDPDAALALIDATWNAYHKPIWVTEFCPADFSGKNDMTPEATLAYMKRLLPELEKRSYIERYAWFGPPTYTKMPAQNCRLFDKNGNLNNLGKYYADFKP